MSVLHAAAAAAGLRRRRGLPRAALPLLALFLATAAPSPASAAEEASPEALFNARCGVCHLKGGGGTWMLGRRLGDGQSLLAQRTDLQPAYVRYVARFGLRAMPRFTRVELPDTELEAITQWLTRPGPRP